MEQNLGQGISKETVGLPKNDRPNGRNPLEELTSTGEFRDPEAALKFLLNLGARATGQGGQGTMMG